MGGLIFTHPTKALKKKKKKKKGWEQPAKGREPRRVRTPATKKSGLRTNVITITTLQRTDSYTFDEVVAHVMAMYQQTAVQFGGSYSEPNGNSS